MKKKLQADIAASLSSALEPPKRKPSDKLNNILNEFAPPPAAAPAEPTPPTPRTPRTPPTDATHPIAPERDFTRVANSIVRDVVPGGHFTGKSKQIYDYLYQRTRGAVVPVRRVSISKPALMRGSGVGSERTLLKNLGHLKTIGLVRVEYTDGKHEGNTYEVFLPEEVGLRTPRTPPTPPTARHPRAEVPPVPPAESGVRGVGSDALESRGSGDPKTFTKTDRSIDDEPTAFTGVIEAFTGAVKELTGKTPVAADEHRWREVADVLIAELKIAAARTTVSSVPAFLAEHLRRRLWKTSERLEREAEKPPQGDSGPAINISECPDCFGTSMYYPEGYERGVKRCSHERLKGK